MADFVLSWDNTNVLASANSLKQRVSYRRKDVGGAWIVTGVIPVNDMATSETSATVPSLIDNVVYEFKVENICTTGGPTINSNGIREQIIFNCITPAITTTDVASTIAITVTSLNIIKAKFTLKKQSDNSIVYGPVTTSVAANIIQATATGLTASTAYYWQIELIASVNGIEVNSATTSGYIGASCGAYNTTTTIPSPCTAPTNLVVTQTPP